MDEKKTKEAWDKTQDILSLRKEKEEYEKSFKLTAEARRRFCRGF